MTGGSGVSHFHHYLPLFKSGIFHQRIFQIEKIKVLRNVYFSRLIFVIGSSFSNYFPNMLIFSRSEFLNSSLSNISSLLVGKI